MSLRCLYDSGETIYRVLAEHDVEVLVIDCLKKTMPFWIQKDQINGYLQIDEKVLHENSGIRPVEEDTLSKSALSVALLLLIYCLFFLQTFTYVIIFCVGKTFLFPCFSVVLPAYFAHFLFNKK